MKRLLFTALFCTTALLATSQTARQDSVWLFSYFKNNGEDGLHLAYSTDGLQWIALNNDSSFLGPTAGKDKLMRDPCIIQGPDGRFHMVWTVSWNEKGIGYASSTDLVHWSPQQYLPVMEHEKNALNCWAPEITYDPARKEYMIYWATTIPGRFPQSDSLGDQQYNHRMYYVTTKDFKTYSKTRLLYEPGFNVIDATIVKAGSRYMMFLKDETLKPQPQKNIRVAYSQQLTGPYGKPSAPITGRYWAEGPTVMKMGNEYLVYFDKYTEGQFGALASSDLTNWTDLSDKIRMPKGIRHGSIMKIAARQLATLQGARGQ